jgi:hypothetical protein
LTELPHLLCIPRYMRTVEQVLGTAQRLNLPEVIVLSQLPEGGLVWLANDDMTCERANWLLDMFKHFLLTAPMRVADLSDIES